MIDENKLIKEINNFYYDKEFNENCSISALFANIMTIINNQPKVDVPDTNVGK